jgi:hypothetical protein
MVTTCNSCWIHKFLWNIYIRQMSDENKNAVVKCTSSVRTYRYILLQEGDIFVCFWRNSPQWARPSSFTRFLNHIQRRTTVGRTPLDEWSVRRRDLYLITHNTHNRKTSMPLVGFEPTISAGERPQTYGLDRAATATGKKRTCNRLFHINFRYPNYIFRFIKTWLRNV